VVKTGGCGKEMLRAIFVGSLFVTASCFAQVHAGHGGYGNGYHGGGYGYSHGGRGGYVFAYPVYIGGYGLYNGYYGDYSSGYAPAYPDPSLQPAPQPAPAPPVVINQYFGGPPQSAGPQMDPSQAPDDQAIHFYQQQPNPSAYAQQPVSDNNTFLIAYKDHSVYTAIAYWIDGRTLHYITAGNVHNQADLNLIDVDFTKKLNADRSMPFNVPAL
jgi:hypothetical protein